MKTKAMANKPIKLRINVLNIAKQHLYKGAKGTYLDCAVWPNKNGADDYGFTHRVVQEVSREAREAGEKGPIIGNLAMPEQEQQQQSRPPQREREWSKPEPKGEAVTADGMDEDDIPF